MPQPLRQPWRRGAILVGAGHATLLAIMLAMFLSAHAGHPNLPSGAAEADGWAGWFDQSQYVKASRAWAELDLSRSRHWYPPGYAILGAPFLGLTPHDRFLLPDVACLVAAQLACASLSRRLLCAWPAGGLAGAAAFAFAAVGTPAARAAWVVPWTTTPSVALTFAAFVAALRMAERPAPARAALAGACIGAIALFRPSDAAPAAVAAAAALAPSLLRLPVGRGLLVGGLALLAAGGAALAAVALMAATNGFGPGSYLGGSAAIGFEWRLLPLRWVSLVASPRPLFDGAIPPAAGLDVSHGLAERFPWVVAGVGGAAACLASGRVRAAHVLLATWLAAHLALTLAYRDLHVVGLWAFGNVHYLKGTLPIFLLFALAPLERLAGRRGSAAPVCAAPVCAALAAVVLAFGWRASLSPTGESLSPPFAADAAVLPGLSGIRAAAVVGGGGAWSGASGVGNTLTVDGRRFVSDFDFRIYLRAGDMLIVPLRPLPAALGLLRPAAGVTLDATRPVLGARQKIVFGLPCMFGIAGRAVCKAETVR